MGERNFIKALSRYANLNDQQLRLNKMNEVKDYFVAKIKERVLMTKRLINILLLLIILTNCFISKQ